MTDFEKIKTAFARQNRVLELRPGVGRGTAVTTVNVTDGLTCEIREGDWRMTVDLNEKWGGNGVGPNPGVYGRGALGSCLAIAYMMWAGRLGIPVSSLSVDVHADYDTRGMCGDDKVPPGYSAIRYVVNIESAAEESEVKRLLDTADSHCTYLDNFRRALPVHREARISKARD